MIPSSDSSPYKEVGLAARNNVVPSKRKKEKPILSFTHAERTRLKSSHRKKICVACWGTGKFFIAKRGLTVCLCCQGSGKRDNRHGRWQKMRAKTIFSHKKVK